jgi:hypothetical protein
MKLPIQIPIKEDGLSELVPLFYISYDPPICFPALIHP